MKLTKGIIKWNMVVIPCLVFVILLVGFQGNDRITTANIAAITISSTIIWLIFSLIALGIVTLIGRAKHEKTQ